MQRMLDSPYRLPRSAPNAIGTLNQPVIAHFAVSPDAPVLKLIEINMSSINVTVYDSTENKRVPVELPDDAPVNRIITVLIEKLSLPKQGPDGAPLSYKFH